jgi:2'-5' RNA ligase
VVVIRAFVAVAPDDEVRHRMAHLLMEHSGRGLPGRVVPPENWHITVRFLGEIDDLQRDKVAAALDGADLGPAFAVRWGRLGAFPRPRRANVLWVGLDEGGEAMERLAAQAEGALETAGFPSEDRPFRAHLTLSRIRPHQDVAHLVEAVPALGVPMTVDRIVLVRSHLGRGGARYEEIESFPLDRP